MDQEGYSELPWGNGASGELQQHQLHRSFDLYTSKFNYFPLKHAETFTGRKTVTKLMKINTC